MSATRTPKPRRGRPRKDLRLDTSVSEDFLRLPIEERERRLKKVDRVFREAFAGLTVDDLIHEKRREAARDN